MKIAICDDDMNCINKIENYIEKIDRNNAECDAYQNGERLVQAFKTGAEQYDVIFLDMEMEKLNGIETANLIREVDEHVIIVFVTSHTEYMRESFKCAPFRFLVKPVDPAEFKTVFYDIGKSYPNRERFLHLRKTKPKYVCTATT